MSEKRFTLEEKIMACWGVVDDLSTVYKNVDYRDKDQVANALLGLHTLYSMKFEELWQAFEDHLQEQGESNLADKWAYLKDAKSSLVPPCNIRTENSQGTAKSNV